MDAYVAECAEALFTARARGIRQWLTDTRGIPETVLRANKVGADLGPRHQSRPDGMPRAAGAVLPTLVDGHAVYAQVRVTHPRGQGPRYLNPTSDLATNPRLAHFSPPSRDHDGVIVSEGAIDALSAAAAGYQSVAVLSASYPDRAIALELSRLDGRLIIAFDQDDAGQAAADRLTELLDGHQRHPARLSLPENDLNECLVRSSGWPKEMSLRVNACLQPLDASLGKSLV